MAKIERTYTIPLRKSWRKAPSYKRAKRAVTAVQRFIKKHMKSDDVKIGRNLNKKIWERGIKNPPHKIKVNLVKEESFSKAEEREIISKIREASGLKVRINILPKIPKSLSGKRRIILSNLP